MIISGGGHKEINHNRYWNDCSSIYRKLVNQYNYDPSHITVIMSDGTDSGIDMSSNQSSPLDLDGNGTNDIQLQQLKKLIIMPGYMIRRMSFL